HTDPGARRPVCRRLPGVQRLEREPLGERCQSRRAFRGRHLRGALHAGLRAGQSGALAEEPFLRTAAFAFPRWFARAASLAGARAGAPALVACGPASSATRNDGAQRLTSPATASDQNPCFSPDGSSLIFTRFEGGYNLGPAHIYRLDLGDESLPVQKLTD